MALTDAAIWTAKPREKTYRLHDAAGLYLAIMVWKRSSMSARVGFRRTISVNRCSTCSRRKELSCEFSVTVVQPGYVKTAFEPSHLEVFVSMDALLMDTWGMKFRVIAAQHV